MSTAILQAEAVTKEFSLGRRTIPVLKGVGRAFDRVATYELGEACYASPAISDGQVFLRGFQHLFCMGQRQAN